MKGFKLLFFLVFPLVLSGQVEFAPIGAEWHYSVNIPGYSPYNYYTFQQVEKDTLIGDTLCHKVSRLSLNPRGDSLPGVDLFHVRSDSLFYFNRLSESFHLLFDYTAEAGDTVYCPPILQFEGPYGLIIDSVTLIEIDGQLLRQYHTDTLGPWFYKTPCIEKIGASGGLLPSPDLSVIPTVGPIGYSDLRCYRDSFINWKRIEMDCDTWLMASDVEEPPIPEIRLWPQPASRHLMVEGWEKIKRGRYEIFGMDGKKWMSLPVAESVPVGKLPNGAYFLRIISEGRQRVLRFYKME